MAEKERNMSTGNKQRYQLGATGLLTQMVSSLDVRMRRICLFIHLAIAVLSAGLPTQPLGWEG